MSHSPHCTGCPLCDEQLAQTMLLDNEGRIAWHQEKLRKMGYEGFRSAEFRATPPASPPSYFPTRCRPAPKPYSLALSEASRNPEPSTPRPPTRRGGLLSIVPGGAR